MSERLSRQQIANIAIIHAAPAQVGVTTVDRSFGLPTALYASTAVFFAGFVVVMALGFGNPHLIVPMGIIAAFLAMFFAVPSTWVRMKPDQASGAKSWARFQHDGIMTPFGRTSAAAATVQVLILPALVFLWGVAVVTIAALVR